MILSRLLQEEKAFYGEGQAPMTFEVPDLDDGDEDLHALVSDKSVLDHGKLVLEEYVISAEEDPSLKALAQQLDSYFGLEDYMASRLVLLPDSLFKQFADYSTEINTRIRIDYETGTVADKALFYEENVPAEALFYAFFTYQDSKRASKGTIDLDKISSGEAKKFVDEKLGDSFQVGGNASIGRGMMQRAVADKKEA